MGYVAEDLWGCDEGFWLVRLVSFLLVPVRDIVSGGHQVYWLWLTLTRQLGYLSPRRADHILPLVYLQHHDGHSIGGCEGIVAEGLVAEGDPNSQCDFIGMGDALIGLTWLLPGLHLGPNVSFV
ncbi:hypothetical protein GMDG_04237 [Pseudogymnoascus destructans 20631-21]|uniref:Uncharacterized protein n=1 Tax=Pseudogymnoascus destructans (strain ATCC MYA-4855 / 20631-21) TaxID=658429 RepID=L8GCH6_PSED2|nr:hypothetical protein GMDG_04237 [Pseudogymnoascus destructans 20631-21]